MNTVDQHFNGKEQVVRDIYDKLLVASRSWGEVIEDPKKTSIHLNRRYAFAGVATGKSHLVLTVKCSSVIPSTRVRNCRQASSNRWYCEVRLTSPDEVDDEIMGWLRTSYELS